MNFVFAKLHCEQSDYLIANAAPPENQSRFCAGICNRRTGAGADGVIFVQKSGDVYFARQFSPDGEETALFDTALRCAAKYLSLSNVKENSFIINKSKAKILSSSLIKTTINNLSFEPQKIVPLRIKQQTVNKLCEICGQGVYLTAVQCGLPYAVVFCNSLFDLDVNFKGGQFKNSRIFDNGINVVFIQLVENNCVKLRVYRSGCGEVPLCTNAAAAAVFTANYLQLCSNEVNVVFDKGAVRIKLRENKARIWATAYYIGSFEIKE